MASTKRRSSVEVRELLVTAAVEEFSTKGYAGTTIQSVADAAGLTASAVYQHFEGKSDLFSHAVLRPFLTFLDGFSAVWQRQRQAPWDGAPLMRAVIEELFDDLGAQRSALLEVAAARGHLSEEVFDEVRKLSTRMFLELRVIGEEEMGRRGFPTENVEMSFRLVVAMVTAMTVFDVWLVPSFPSPISRDALIDQMTRFAIGGTTATPADIAAASQAPGPLPSGAQ